LNLKEGIIKSLCQTDTTQ